MGSLAKAMGYAFDNSGAVVKFQSPYFAGTARMQAQECAEAGGFNWIIGKDTLAIWPVNSNRVGSAVVVSIDKGIVGYPSFVLKGAVVKMLCNSVIRYGTLINVQNTLKPATGHWAVIRMLYELESETMDGAWKRASSIPVRFRTSLMTCTAVSVA